MGVPTIFQMWRDAESFARVDLSSTRMALFFGTLRFGAERQRTAERLRVTMASIGDAVITTDDQGRVTQLNAVAEALTGWTVADAVDKRMEDVFVIINEESRRPVESPIGRVLRENVIVGLANHTVLIAKDGREIPVDDSAAPIKSADGRVVGVVLVFRDVTERPETIECGSNILSGANPPDILRCVAIVLKNRAQWTVPPEYLVNDVTSSVVRLVLGYR